MGTSTEFPRSSTARGAPGVTARLRTGSCCWDQGNTTGTLKATWLQWGKL